MVAVRWCISTSSGNTRCSKEPAQIRQAVSTSIYGHESGPSMEHSVWLHSICKSSLPALVGSIEKQPSARFSSTMAPTKTGKAKLHRTATSKHRGTVCHAQSDVPLLNNFRALCSTASASRTSCARTSLNQTLCRALQELHLLPASVELLHGILIP